MEMLGNNSKLFKNVFPDYQTFKSWYISTPLSDNDKDVPSEKTFTLIAFEYNDSHIAHSVEGFKQHFANDIYSFYKEFEETTKAISELMKLTDEEISTADSMIINTANIPETESSTNEEEVNFISTQQKNISKKGKLQIKKEQLSNKRVFTVKTFINRFRHLFIKILSPAYNLVIAEEQED